MNLKIIMSDDKSLVCVGLKVVLKSEFPNAVIHSSNSYSELVACLQENFYDLVLLDINMDAFSDLNVLHDLKHINPKIYIIIFSYHDEHIALRYINKGADGFISKSSSEQEIKFAINSVLKNGFYYPQKLVKLALKSNPEDIKSNLHAVLSERELEVFNLFLSGNKNLQIATLLGLHMSTVSTFKKRILEKLKVNNLTDLVKRYHHFEIH